jgi:outer membrane protein TolC
MYPSGPSQSGQRASQIGASQMPSSTQQNPFTGSRTVGQPTPGVLQLTLLDAIERGLRNNLGLITAGYGSESTRATRLHSLAEMLPDITGNLRYTSQQVNLAAFGLSGFPGLPTVVGPFSVVDARAYFKEDFDLKSLNRFRSDSQLDRAAGFNVRDARELVVLVIGGLYLQAIADAARVETAQAQLNTATALFNQATDMHRAGTIPGIDTLRAQVEMQAEQQRLVAARNEFEKQKLRLARAIGLPTAQQFALADTIPYAPVPELTLERALQVALDSRADYKAAQARVSAAQKNKLAMQTQRVPGMEVTADYGAIGPRPATVQGTYTAAATVKIPIFESGRIHADVMQAEALLKQRQAEADNLRGQIEFEVRSAFLDVQAAADLVQVAQQAVGLAEQALTQSRDRFASGVTNSVEVVQSQQAVTAAQENYIASLNAHNVAKLVLARSLGVAERQVHDYLQGRHK